MKKILAFSPELTILACGLHFLNTVRFSKDDRMLNNLDRLNWELDELLKEQDRILRIYGAIDKNNPMLYFEDRYYKDTIELKEAISDIEKWRKLDFTDRLLRFPPKRLLHKY